ncbi:ATPase WRNIP1-like [Planococcus citri]|uniref:ATPase WRNIP1-like n=1 Tax=Planococcus citri TaxID=170843 RepID=UPI0031F78F1D
MDTNSCPVCDKVFSVKEIERHVNNCLFLNSRNETPATTPKRKRDNNESPQSTKQVKTSTSTTAATFPGNVEVEQPENNNPPEADKPKEYAFKIPLAEALRPTDLEDFVGQEKAIGSGTLLRKLLNTADIPSLILWGPPGCGKTTLANVIKETLLKRAKNKKGALVRFVKLHATTAGVNDVKEVINIAKNEMKMFQKRTILFMDEIHRFNKSQQDTFLPHIENGTITLIGATTQNPSFSLNNALLSRCRVITFDKLSVEDIVDILHRAVEHVGGYIGSSNENEDTQESFIIDEDTIKWLAEISDGDARIALNSLQMAIQSKNETNAVITLSDIKESIKRSHLLYDRNGDEHYNIISALHKSVRASDDNAALYWLARMIEGGEDPIYIARRLVRAAAEDIGLADPQALVLAVSTLHGCQTIGMPESDVLLAQLAVYLARAPKSTEVYMALKDARKFIKEFKGPQPSVPLDLRNAPTKMMKDMGYGQHYNKQHKDVSGLTYMPEGLETLTFFSK